jgi:hypothetical protein
VVIGDGADAIEVVVEGTAAEAFDADEPPWASAGSWPVTSCTRIPPVVARNVQAARLATRRRIERTRRRRSARRCAGVGESVGFTPTTVQGVIRRPVTVA